MNSSSKNSSNVADEANEETTTERGEQRKQEDDQFVPVIVKRTDETRRHPDDTLQRAVEEGLEQIRRPMVSLAISAIVAGLILGFAAMAVGVTAKFALQFDTIVITRFMIAVVYPLGFVMCILGGAQLFTEHTATAVYPVLDKKASLLSLLRLWAIVVVGNLIGAALSAGLLSLAEPVIEAREGYVIVARHLVHFEIVPLLASSVLAGWLMAQGGWLLLGTSQTSGQMFSIYLVTFLIGVGGLHHSIAGSAEVFASMMVAGEPSIGHAARFIGLALLGNLIGGSTFVAVLNYAHIRGT